MSDSKVMMRAKSPVLEYGIRGSPQRVYRDETVRQASRQWRLEASSRYSGLGYLTSNGRKDRWDGSMG